MRYIEHIIEPDRLLLSWQAREGQDRGRHIVAELLRRGDDADLVYLGETADYEAAVAKGFKGEYPGLPGGQNHDGVLPVFSRRLPPRYRKDYGKFLEAIRLRPDAVVSDFALLGYAGGRLPSDDFCLIHPFDGAAPPFEFLLLVAGYRYYRQDVPYDKIQSRIPARFELEPDNPHDPDAVRVVFPDVSDATAGYVCRGLLPQFRKWLLAGLAVQATVERKNGPDEQPSVYLFVEVREGGTSLCPSGEAATAAR